MRPKQIIILATTHQLQRNGHTLNARLRGAIDLVQQQCPIEIIFEEWWYMEEPSFASTLATGTLKYENVGTPDEPRFKTLTECLNNNPPTYNPAWPRLPEYGPLDAQERREQYMVSRITELMKPYDAGLFIVGLAHLHSTFCKLIQTGFEVSGYSWME
jgi:hypothetical protein